MDWDKLRIFKAVADAGSFTHAGEILHLSQSAISRQISTLEEDLGVVLFHRHARGLVLTEQGEILSESATEVFEKLKITQTRLSDSRKLPEGPLTVTTVEFIASSWLAPQIGAFKDLYPDIQITLLLDDRVYDLAKREADVAIRLHKSQQNDMIEKYMTTIGFRLCISKPYVKKRGIPKDIADLKNHIMIGHPQDTQTPFIRPNWIFNEIGIEPYHNKNVILINSMHARYSAVKSGVGIAILPDYISRQDEDIEPLFPDLKIPEVDMYFVYPQERRNSMRINLLKDFLFKRISEKV